MITETKPSATPLDLKTLEIHTLGPRGTNCEAAARHWLAEQGVSEPQIVLHRTLEEATVVMLADDGRTKALLACVVYPYLHDLVFKNLADMAMLDCFVMPTYPMVLASPGTTTPTTVASHPAPMSLIEGRGLDIHLANSNAEAALRCAAGEVDACITTSVAAERAGLILIQDFGPVPMGFSVHVPQNLITKGELQ
jgi:prephenate dehydratase